MWAQIHVSHRLSRRLSLGTFLAAVIFVLIISLATWDIHREKHHSETVCCSNAKQCLCQHPKWSVITFCINLACQVAPASSRRWMLIIKRKNSDFSRCPFPTEVAIWARNFFGSVEMLIPRCLESHEWNMIKIGSDLTHSFGLFFPMATGKAFRTAFCVLHLAPVRSGILKITKRERPGTCFPNDFPDRSPRSNVWRLR